MRFFTLILVFCFALVALSLYLLSSLNKEIVLIDLLFTEIQLSLGNALLGFFILGFSTDIIINALIKTVLFKTLISWLFASSLSFSTRESSLSTSFSENLKIFLSHFVLINKSILAAIQLYYCIYRTFLGFCTVFFNIYNSGGGF